MYSDYNLFPIPVVIVKNDNLAKVVNSNTNDIVSDAFASNLAQEFTGVVENFDTVSSVVRNEDFVFVVRANAVREFEMFGALDSSLDIAVRVKDNDAHDLALNHNDSALIVNTNSTRMLEDVSAEFAQELAILIVDLNLMSWTAFGHNEVSSDAINCHTKQKRLF